MCSEILLSILRPIFSLHPPDLVHFARLRCHSETLSVCKMNLVSVLCVLCSLLSLCVFPSVRRASCALRFNGKTVKKKQQNKTKQVQRGVQPMRNMFTGKKNSRFCKNWHWVEFFFFNSNLFGLCLCEGFLQRLLGFSEVKVTFEQLFMALFYFYRRALERQLAPLSWLTKSILIVLPRGPSKQPLQRTRWKYQKSLTAPGSKNCQDL